jgi:hypothetical protein
MKEEHNIPGHINIYKKDHGSHITGFGKHERVVAFIPDPTCLYCRIDLCWGLPIPSQQQVLKVAKHYGDARGKWALKSWEEYEQNNNKHIEVLFQKLN